MTTAQTVFFVIYSCLYYLIFPLVVILKWLLIALGVIVAPLLHLGQYILHACLWPLRFLAKFEVCRDATYLMTNMSIGRTNHVRRCTSSLALPLSSAPSRA